MSESQKARFAELEARGLAASVKPPETKICTKCEVRKPLSEFYMRKKKLKSGVRYYPCPRCKACDKAYVKQWKRNNIEQVREHENASHKKESYKKRVRENRRIRRRLAGIKPRGPWLKYRGEEEKPILVPAQPFVGWVESFLRRTADELDLYNGGPQGRVPQIKPRYTVSGLARMAGQEESWLRHRMTGIRLTVALEDVDAVLTACGEQYMLRVLYPSELV